MIFKKKEFFGLILIMFLLIANKGNAYDPRENVIYSKNSNNLFWFVQVSDTHIGMENEYESVDISNFNWMLLKGLQDLNPEFIINTGDLTDATDGSEGWPWYGLDRQQVDEWIDYRRTLDDNNIPFDRYYDIPGNHDRYNDINWNGVYDPATEKFYGYKFNSYAFDTSNPIYDISNPVGEYSWIKTFQNGDYLFLGVNTCDETGISFSSGYKGTGYTLVDMLARTISDNPELSVVERNYIDSTLTNFYATNPTQKKLSFIFGHSSIYRLVNKLQSPVEYKLNELGQYRGGPQFVGLLNQYNVSLYMFGHTHKNRDIYDLNSSHGITTRLINTSSLTEQDEYRIVAVDNNGVSTRTFNKNKWPQVLATSPLDFYASGLNSAYNQQTINDPFAYTLKSDSTNFVRALVFFSPLQTNGNKVEFRARKKSILPWFGGWNQMANISGKIYQANWDCSGLEAGEYELEVKASSEDIISLDYPSEDIHKIIVIIDNNECVFLYPNGGQILKGEIPLKAVINRDDDFEIRSLEYSYSDDNKDSWKGVLSQSYIPPITMDKNIETMFNSKTKGISSGEVWFKVKIGIANGLLGTIYAEDESDTTVTIDNIFPTIPQNLSAKPVKAGAIELSWVSSIDSTVDNLAGYRIYRNTMGQVDYELTYDGITETLFTDMYLENGREYYYKVKAYDLAGNESDSSNIATAIADSEPPVAEDIYPLDSSFINMPRPEFSSNIVDTISGIDTTSLKIELDSTEYNVDSYDILSGKFTFTPDYDLAEGNHNWKIKSHDLAGNEIDTTIYFSFTLDTTNPITPVINSLPSLTNIPAINITGFAEPESIVALYNDTALYDTTTAGLDSSFIFSDYSLIEGENIFTVTATDKAGNVSEVSDAVVVVLDTTKPNISEVFPPDGYVTDMNDHDISATISDTNGLFIDSITIILNGEVKAVEKTTGDDFVVDIRYQPQTSDLLVEGANKWKVSGQDLAVNQIMDVEHILIVDTKPPKVESYSMESE